MTESASHPVGRRRWIRAAQITILTVLFAVFMIPFALVLINAFKYKRDIISDPFSLWPDKGFTFENFTAAFLKMDYLQAFANSLSITGLATFAVIFLSAMLAYYIVRAYNRIGKIMYTTMVVSMIIPFQAIMIPLVSIYGAQLNLLNNRLTLVFLHTGFAMSLSVFMYSGFLRSSISVSLEEAAYLDGCSHAGTFWKIMLPLVQPAVITVTIFNFMSVWNEFFMALIFTTSDEMMPVGVGLLQIVNAMKYTGQYGAMFAAVLIVFLPTFLLYIFMSEKIIAGVTGGGVKG